MTTRRAGMFAGLLSPSRRRLNPVLTDDPIMDSEADAATVFYSRSAQRLDRHVEWIVAAASGFFLVVAWLVSSRPAVHNLFVLLSFTIAGIPAISQVWQKLSKLRFDIDSLMLLGALLAAYIGNAFEGALLLFLFALSGALEHLALARTKAAIVDLHELAPKEANLLSNGDVVRVSLRRIVPEQVVLVRAGEKIPLDGVVIAGSSSVDESAITGESVPRQCVEHDTVYAGTQNLDGRLEVRVTRAATETTLARVVALVREAKRHPARAQRLVDRIGPAYSVSVVVASVTIALAGAALGLPGAEATRRGIAFLIVASPCALIIATPVAYLSAIAAGARRGVLIKGGAHLESVARSSVFAFDKTGTLTTGNIRMTDIVASQNSSRDEWLALVAALEAASTHPLAQAINEAHRSAGLPTYEVTDYRSTPGHGEEGTVDGRRVWIGRPESIGRQKVEADDDVLAAIESLRSAGKTVSAAVAGNDVALFAFEDPPREQSENCIARLRSQGVTHVAMLTGDHPYVARSVASRLAIDQIKAELKPEDKVSAMEELRAQYGPVVLVGDGVNDAPALARADVGVAMGSMGADIALDAADIVLMKDRIERVAWLHAHARRTASIVRQNLALAIGVIVALGALTVTIGVPLPIAVVGHEGSTVLVALNALRLMRTAD